MTQQVERMLPLYEGKMGWQYDHRFASFYGTGEYDIEPNHGRSHEDRVLPRYWVREEVVQERLSRRPWGTSAALLGFRRVARNTDERTVVASTVPYGAASYGWILSAGPTAGRLLALIAQYNSFCFDYVLRQFLSQPSIPQGTFAQLPILPPRIFERLDGLFAGGLAWLETRVLFLVGPGEEMSRLVEEVRGVSTRAIPWGEPARAAIRTELDALMFHLFGVSRDDVEYMMDSFQGVRKADEKEFGSYRTKEQILEVYDAMQDAIDAGSEYHSPLDKMLNSLGLNNEESA